jgi:hypothetical protein
VRRPAGRTPRSRALAALARGRIQTLAERRWKLDPLQADDLAFHLTDWIVDLEDLHRLFTSRRWNARRAAKVIDGFVAHAPVHLAAAHRLLFDLPLTDTFHVGAVQGTGRPPGGKRARATPASR